MRKIIRNVIAILLCVTGLILLVLPSVPAEAVAVTRGDFVIDGLTLVKYTGHEANLTVPDTIETIGKEAFSGNVSLRSVTILDPCRTIDYAAFENCSNLQIVNLPRSVRTIGSSAFSGCTSLYSINIPDKVDDIGSGSFAACPSLSSIDVSAANPEFLCSDGVLYTGDGKEIVQYLAGRASSTYAMPLSVEKIREYAFWGADNLTGVAISSNVHEIEEYSFANCPALSAIIIPPTVTKIQAYAFSDCENLRSAVIPTSVGYIDDLAFYMSDGVKVQLVEPDSPLLTPQVAAVSGNGLTGTAVANDAQNGDASGEGDAGSTASEPTGPVIIDYEENVLPGELGSTKIVGSKAVLLMSPAMQAKDSYNLNKAELEDGIANSNLTNTGREEPFSIIRSVLDRYNGSDQNVEIPSDVIRIGNRSFYKNNTIENVSIPDSVNSVGDFAFARSTLKSVKIPDSVTEIGYASFYQCNDLEDVTIPDSVESIELGAFLGTPWLYNWQTAEDSDNYLIVGDKILLSYKGEGGNITIPEGVKTIAAGCFTGNTDITGVSIPGSVRTIGEDAFNGCTSLNTISLSNGVETIEDRAFCDTDLSTLTIPPSVSKIGLGAFDVLDSAPLSTVLFTGTTIPNVMSKPTASRLSASDLRTLAFDGIDNAIVRDTADLSSGSLFNPQYLGFRGAVYSISPDQVDGQNTLHLLKCNKEPDDTGVVDIDSHVSVGSTNYVMSGVKDNAFSDYSSLPAWSDKPLTDIRINGNTSDGVEALMDSVANAERTVYTEDTAITVSDERAGTAANAAYAHARIPGSADHYLLTARDDKESAEAFRAAFLNAMGKSLPAGIQLFDLSMTDATGMIPINRLNTDKMEVTLPVPSTLAGNTDLTVLSLNDNGALETLATETVTEGDAECVKFVTGHFSPYAICRSSDLYAVSTDPAEFAEDAGEDITDISEPVEVEVMQEARDFFSLRGMTGSLTKSGGNSTGIPFAKAIAVCCLVAGAVLLLFNLKGIRKKRA